MWVSRDRVERCLESLYAFGNAFFISWKTNWHHRITAPTLGFGEKRWSSTAGEVFFAAWLCTLLAPRSRDCKVAFSDHDHHDHHDPAGNVTICYLPLVFLPFLVARCRYQKHQVIQWSQCDDVESPSVGQRLVTPMSMYSCYVFQGSLVSNDPLGSGIDPSPCGFHHVYPAAIASPTWNIVIFRCWGRCHPEFMALNSPCWSCNGQPSHPNLVLSFVLLL